MKKFSSVHSYSLVILVLTFFLTSPQVIADMSEMGGMETGGSQMGGMSSMNGSQMSCPECMDMMGMMSNMGNMNSMGPSSNLPGFPGASHIYHIGADGFFVNHHPQHIQLSIEQQTKLNQTKEKALMSSASSEREVDAAEQQLFLLTASDQPDISKIEAQLRTIGKLRVQQRLDYIRAVGEAANILTADQRAILTGAKSSDTLMLDMN
jgi:Spy/CpxP family protein refolding chaperone